MKYVFLESVDSTNKYAKEHISEFSDRTVIYTDCQTSGRGRLERKWCFMGKDNIYASLILKPSDEMKEIYSNLTQLLCVVLAETFEEYGKQAEMHSTGSSNSNQNTFTPSIKWPNDIQINGKKISGILAEGVVVNDSEGGRYKLEGLVLGFGVNLNTKIENLSKIDQSATSLNIELGHDVDKKIFLKKVLEKFCLLYDRFIENGFLLIRDDYIRRAGFLNKEVTVRVFDKTITGIAKDITDNGALKLIDKNNEEHVLLIGDIL